MFDKIKKNISFRKSNLVDSDGNMYLAVDTMIVT